MDATHELSVQPEDFGLSTPLSRQVRLLASLLAEALRAHAGARTLELMETLSRACAAGSDADYDAAAERIRGLDVEQIGWLLRAYTAFFHLLNEAEKHEIVRINRERSRGREAGPRPESIYQAIERLKAQGMTFAEVTRVLGRLDIQPTLTAHPTEARRRTVLFKQRRILELLDAVQRADRTPEEEEAGLDGLGNEIALLLATEDVRTEQPSVEVEVKQGLYFLRDAIWRTTPEIYRDVQRALRRHFGTIPEVPAFLRYRSWIGGDRDGNPNVTPAVTRWTLDMHRRAALELHLQELAELRRDLSLSERQVPVPQALYASLRADEAASPLDAQTQARYRYEPYRLKISHIMARLQRLLEEDNGADPEQARPVYRKADFVAELELVRRCLEESGYAGVARCGRLEQALWRAHTFGFHLAALDIRQHSRLHEETVAALLRAAGVVEDYAALSEAARQRVLEAELRNPRPLLPRGAELSEAARNTLETLAVVRAAVAREPGAVGSYIVSMTHAVSDLLEVALLAKEAGLWRRGEEGVLCPIDFVPLFETIHDLNAIDVHLEALLSNACYREQVAARGDFQEIMIGYSDSNKDGGYWMANWVLHEAQQRIARVCAAHGVACRLFHGRGGTVERGGGQANQAIQAMPPVVHNGRIRFTEQGEVISFRYASVPVARRHLEQIVHSVITATAAGGPARQEKPPAGAHIVRRLAEGGMASYRHLIDDEGFWPWYTQVTPIRQISRLPIASRPVSRKAGSEVDFAGLRAIPWVFAWTQTRYMVPGWFGLGGALEELGLDRDALGALYRGWPFFRLLIDNAQREMARARLIIAGRYGALGEADCGRFHEAIAGDFERVRELILEMTGQSALLDNNAVIRNTIDFRNPYTDVLNLLQMELMRRYDEAAPNAREGLRQALFLSINGIAAAMQSTG